MLRTGMTMRRTPFCARRSVSRVDAADGAVIAALVQTRFLVVALRLARPFRAATG